MSPLALAILAVINPAPVAPAKPTVAGRFEFRDWHARDAYKADDPRLRQCVAVAAGTACAFSDNRIAGVEARQIGAAFGRGGLFALEAKFASENGPVVHAALQKRYGAPCESRVERPRQLMTGQVVPRVITVWCFSDGRATYSSMTTLRSEASFEFATHDAAAQAGVADF